MDSVADDFFPMWRLDVAVPRSHVRCLLSDVTAAPDWPLARQVIDDLDLPVPDGDPARPGGEILMRIAERLGFGPAFRRVISGCAGVTRKMTEPTT